MNALDYMGEIVLTAQQAAEIDRYAKERLGIQTLMLMENAGRAVAEVALDLLGEANQAHIAVFCGRGNNAGDGFVAARHLITQGRDADVYLLSRQAQIRNEAEINLDILKKLTDRIFEIKDSADLQAINLKAYAVIIDALFGIGLRGEVGGLFKETISLINKSGVRIVAIDIPSGLDATTGEVHGIAIRADTTVTFMARKKGLLAGQGPEYCGKILVRGLGTPIGNF